MRPLYPLSRRAIAFRWTVEALFERNENIYLWTFTWKVPHADDYYRKSWDKFRHYLQYNFPLLCGLRVFEMHPGSWRLFGESHGLHVHALFNQRVDINRLRKLSDRCGFGRINVKPCDINGAYYLAKYLTKKAERPLPKGMRAFGTIGFAQGNGILTRVRDVKIESQFTNNVTTWQRRLRCRKMTPDIIHTIYVNTILHGAVENWPIGRIKYHGKNAEKIFADLMLPPAKCKSKELIARKWKTQAEDRAKWIRKDSPPVSSRGGVQKSAVMKEEAVEIGADYWKKFPGMTDGTRLFYYRRVAVTDRKR